MRFPAKTTSSCIWVAIGCHTCRLSYFTLVCLWCGRVVERAGGRTVTWLPNFLGWVDYFIFLPMVLCCESSAIINFHFIGEFKKFVPYCWRVRTEAGSSTFFAFVILLLKPLRSFFLIYFNYLIFVFFILHHYYNILLLLLFYLLKQVKQFLAPRSNKSEQHKFLKLSLLIMHRSWEYREKSRWSLNKTVIDQSLKSDMQYR